jgi:hypothetical protein
MILIEQGTSSKLICTLQEKRTTDAAMFLFRFKHILTAQVIDVFQAEDQNISAFKERYDEFVIATQDYFTDAPLGFYTYEVFEMVSESEFANSLPIESGRAFLKNDTAHNYTEYRPQLPQTFKVYNGE